MSSARAANQKGSGAAFKSSCYAFLCLLAVLVWVVRSVCIPPVELLPDGPVAMLGSAKVPFAPDSSGGPEVYVEAEETEVEGEEASSGEELDDGDDGAEEACASLSGVSALSPPVDVSCPEERSPSTQGCVRRHPRPAEAV